MARVTVEDCLKLQDNRFALVVMAAQRARQIAKGAPALVVCTNKPAVVALREIAGGFVSFYEDVKATIEDYIKEVRAGGGIAPR